jgi:multidrug resistance efflux pump
MSSNISEPLRPQPDAPVSDLGDRLDTRDFYDNWLIRLCSRDPCIRFGVLLVRNTQTGVFEPLCQWPRSENFPEGLAGLVEASIEKSMPLVKPLAADEHQAERIFGLSMPVQPDQGRSAMLVLMVRGTVQVVKSLMQMMQWAEGWLRLQLARDVWAEQSARQQQLAGSVDILAAVLSEQIYDQALVHLVAALGEACEAERVAYGEFHRGLISIKQLSHASTFGKRMNLVRLLEAAMLEALDQQQSIRFPLQATETVAGPDAGLPVPLVQSARQLSEHQGQASLLVLPCYLGDEPRGCLLLERRAGRDFTQAEQSWLEGLATMVTAGLEPMRLNDRPLAAQLATGVRDAWRAAVRHRYRTPNLLFKGALLAVLLVCLWPGHYRLGADAELVSDVQRVISAPFDGYIDAAPHRAGDLVAAGDLLVSLDDDDLQLERIRWLSEASKQQSRYQKAVADYDRAEMQVLRASEQQARAQLELTEHKLARVQVRAPFAGRVIAGDLSQQLGSAVRQGDPLFTLSPRDAYRVRIQVDEKRIADVQAGQTGQLYLSALPHQSFPFVVEKMTPETLSEAGETRFVVEARLAGAPVPGMQPGMEGVAKVDIDRRPLISIWSRSLVEWLRLKFWFWLG